MRKIPFIIIGLVLTLVAVVLIVPGVINWNEYKSEISALVKSATGRDVVIKGDIRITILPSPALLADDVRISNIDGATAQDMVRLDKLEVHVALIPLLAGNIRVETINLVRPVIELEVLKNGRKNWQFSSAEKTPPADDKSPTTASVSGDTSPSSGKPAVSALGVRLDSFVINDGTLVYRDVRGGILERVTDINARIAAASLSGPFDSSGNINLRGFPLAYNVSIGKIIHGRTVPLSIGLKVASGAVKTFISGVLVGMDDTPRFKGKIKGEGKTFSGLIKAITGRASLPGFLANKFGFESNVVASASAAKFSNLSISLDDVDAVGGLDVKFGEKINATARLAVSHIDLDKLLLASNDKPKSALKKIIKEATYTRDAEGKPTATIKIGPPKSNDQAPSRYGGTTIPTNIVASLSLSVDAVTFRKRLIRNVLVNTELSGGEMTISQLSAQLPGDSDVAVFGFITVNKGQPTFGGELETSAGDLRGVFKWLGVGMPDVPADRLRKMTLSSKFTITPKQLKINDLDLNFDSSRLTGGMTVALRNPPAFGANLTLDRINLDAYLPTVKSARRAGLTAAKSKGGAAGSLKNKGEKQRVVGKTLPIVGALGVMKSISANAIAKIKTLVYRRTSIKNIVFNGTLNGGDLKVRRASVDRLAGTSANITGEIKGIDGVPKFKSIKIRARIGNFSRLVRLAGIKTKLSGRKLGVVVFNGRVNGPIFKPSIGINLKAAGGNAGLSGTVSLVPLLSGFKGKVFLKHKDAARLIRALNIDYRPAGKIGGLNISGLLKADGSHISLDGIVGKLGKIDISGALAVNIKGPRPVITADIKTGAIAIDDFLPLKRTAALPKYGDARLIPAAWAVQPAPSNSSILVPISKTASRQSRWPTDPINLSALRNFDANIKLKLTALSYLRYRLDGADLAASLKSGELNVSRLQGNLFGGTVNGTGDLKADFNPGIDMNVMVSDMDMGRALKAVSGTASASGRMGLNVKLSTVGHSVTDMISNLGGAGSIALKRLDVAGGGKGTALAGVVDLIAGLNRFGGVLGGGKKGNGLAEITGTFKIADGIARSTDLKLVSTVGDGQAKGSVDLPEWLIDVSGDVNLSRNALTSIISGVTGASIPRVIPFRIKGRLDSPNVKLETPKTSARATGKKGLNGVLNRILPGVLGPPSRQTPPGSPPPPRGERKKVTPKSLLKGLLNAL